MVDDALIRLAGVSLAFRIRRGFFRHDRIPVLRDVSCTVERGETLGVIGRNGSGKSTLLRLLAGVFTPDSGRVESGHASIAMLSLAIGFDAELSGMDNIVLSAMLLGASRDTALAQREQVATFSELGDYVHEPVKIYSTGMRMRLGFSIALMIRPDVILIDEALSVGDPVFREKAEEAITRRIASAQTVVLVSHSLAQVEKLCNRILWLEHGAVRMLGATDEVLAAYADANRPTAPLHRPRAS